MKASTTFLTTKIICIPDTNPPTDSCGFQSLFNTLYKRPQTEEVRLPPLPPHKKKKIENKLPGEGQFKKSSTKVYIWLSKNT